MTQKDRWQFIHTFMRWAPIAEGETEGDLRRKAICLLRWASTHKRIEEELTNGYKTQDGQWDEQRTIKAIAKRNRIDAKMESIAPIVYGALTVSVRMNDREVYIP